MVRKPASHSSAKPEVAAPSRANHGRIPLALLVFVVLSAIQLLFGFTSFWLLISAVGAVGVYLVLPATRSQQGPQQKFANQRGDSQQRLSPAKQGSLSGSESDSFPVRRRLDSTLDEIEARSETQLHSPVTRRKIAGLVTDIRAVLGMWPDLIDHPGHQATIIGTVEQYLPALTNKHIRMPNHMDRRVLTASHDGLDVLIREVDRIHKAITAHRLDELESHAEALRKQFG